MNIAIIEQGFGKYLFEVPESISLKEGEKVKCDTKRGITDGTVWADSITTDEPTSKLIGKLLGAKFPLKSVVGKTVTSVEMFERPEQPKREDKHTYKAGDKVKVINNTCGHGQKIGGVITLNDNDVKVERNAWHYKEDVGYITECDVEPYTEPEKAEPEYLNMWVVCVDDGSCSCCWVVGAPYKVINGEIRDRDGEQMLNNVTSIDDLNSRLNGKFIEFKGK